MESIHVTQYVTKTIKKLGVVVSIIGTISAIGVVYVFYKNNIWKPKISIDSVDWETGVASLTVNGKKKNLFGDTVLAAGGDWGARFTKLPDSDEKGFNRIELIKDDKVISQLAAK